MSNQKQNHPSIKVCIAGTSGSGKTTLFEKLIRRERAKWIFLFDHKDGDLARRFNVKPCRTLDDLLAAVEKGGFVIFDPGTEFQGRKEAGFAFFCDFVFTVCCQVKGKKIFGADELDDLVDARTEPEELCVILDQGRTFQIDCFFIAQAMNGIHNQVRKQMKEIFAFTQGDKSGVEWLVARGFDEKSLFALRNGEWLYKNYNTGAAASGGKFFIPKNANRNLAGL